MYATKTWRTSLEIAVVFPRWPSCASVRRATCKLVPIVVPPFGDNEKMRCDSDRQQAGLRRVLTLEVRIVLARS